MKARFPAMHLSVNGGISNLDQALEHLEVMDGAMIGRAAYHQPYDTLAEVDRRVFGETGDAPSREDVAMQMEDYTGRHLAAGGKLAQITKHMLGLFAGQPGARRWKRVLSEGAHKEGADFALVREALPSRDF